MKLQKYNNSFDFVRFLAASAVLVSHHFPLSGKSEPVVPGFNNTLGGVAVSIFFVMSGFLIYQSLTRSNDINDFIAARLLRIVPNLIFAVILSSVVMLLWFDNYINIKYHIYYIFNNTFSFIQQPMNDIPGVLENRPNTSVNGSLWTLQFEFFMYILLFCVFLLRKELSILSIIVLITIFLKFKFSGSQENLRILTFQLNIYYLGLLGVFFFSGALIAAFWDILKIKFIFMTISSLIFTSVLLVTGNGETIIFYISFSVILICFCNTKLFSKFSKGGDASYGIYIYAFPIQQLCIIVVPNFWVSMIVAFIITVAMGYATWHTFEARFLKFRKPFSQFILLMLRKPKVEVRST